MHKISNLTSDPFLAQTENESSIPSSVSLFPQMCCKCLLKLGMHFDEYHHQFQNFFMSVEISTSNSMGSSEIWDKYHKCCNEIGINTTGVALKMSKIS